MLNSALFKAYSKQKNAHKSKVLYVSWHKFKLIGSCRVQLSYYFITRCTFDVTSKYRRIFIGALNADVDNLGPNWQVRF